MATNVSISPSIQPSGRTQETNGERITVRRDGGGASSGGFSPRTNVSIANSIDNMSAVLSKLSSDRAEAENAIPSQLKDIISNIMKNSFSLDSSISEGVGSSLASQRFSVEQLTNLSRIMQQLGGIAEQSQMETIGDDLHLLFQSISNIAAENSSLEPVMLNKLAFQIINNNGMEQVPKDLQQLLTQLSVLSGAENAASAVQQVPMEQDSGFSFLKQLVDAFFPKPIAISSSPAPQTGSQVVQQQMPQNGSAVQSQGAGPSAQNPAPSANQQPSVLTNMAADGNGMSQPQIQNSASNAQVPSGAGQTASTQSSQPSANYGQLNTNTSQPAGTAEQLNTSTNANLNVNNGNSVAQKTMNSMQEIPVVHAEENSGNNAGSQNMRPAAIQVDVNNAAAGNNQGQSFGNNTAVNSNNTQQLPGNANMQNQPGMQQEGQSSIISMENEQGQMTVKNPQMVSVAENTQTTNVVSQNAGSQAPANAQQVQQPVGPQIAGEGTPLPESPQNGGQTAASSLAGSEGNSSVNNSQPQTIVTNQSGQQVIQPQTAKAEAQPAGQQSMADKTQMATKTSDSMPMEEGSVNTENYARADKGATDTIVKRSFNNMAASYESNAAVRGTKQEMNPLFKQIFNRFGSQPSVQTVTTSPTDARNFAVNVEGNVEVAAAMKDMAQLLMKNSELSTKDTALLRDFINNTQGALSQEDARQLNILLKTVQGNIPAAVQQAGQQSGLEGLPRLYAFMQLSQLATIKTMRSRGYKQASKHIDTFVSSIKGSMVSDGTYKADGQKSISFMMPIYLGENEQSYPAYINIYDEPPHEDERGVMQKDTWFRVCVLTESIGAVDVVCRLYEGNNLNLRVVFSDQEAVKAFTDYLPDIRKNLYDTPINLTDLRVGTVN